MWNLKSSITGTSSRCSGPDMGKVFLVAKETNDVTQKPRVSIRFYHLFHTDFWRKYQTQNRQLIGQFNRAESGHPSFGGPQILGNTSMYHQHYTCNGCLIRIPNSSMMMIMMTTTTTTTMTAMTPRMDTETPYNHQATIIDQVYPNHPKSLLAKTPQNPYFGG